MTKKTFISLLYVLMCTVCFGQEFVHPGMLHTTSDLEFMKAKILAGEEPWKEAWNQLKDSEIASLLNCTPKVGQVKHYPVIERVRYCTGLFPFNRALILLLL